MKFTVHPLFVAVIIACSLFGGLPTAVIFALTALLHECGHVFCAQKLGYECTRLSLMPYGASSLCDLDGVRPRDEIKLALAGPAVNAAICVFLAGLWWFFPQTYAFTDTIMSASLAMLVVNLLPAWPLDGARVARCLLRRFMPVRRADIILKCMDIALAAALVAAFFVSGYNLTYAVFALFLLFSAAERPTCAVRINYASRSSLKRGLEVKCVIVGEGFTVKRAISLLDEGRYLILRNSADGRELTEDELCSEMQRKSIYDSVFD